MKLCPRCDDDITEEPKEHRPPCRIPDCKSTDHSTCEH